MHSVIRSGGINGIDGYVIEVETDISNGLPSFDIVGLGDTTVKESRERVRAAIKNSNLHFPMGRITVNLAPANRRKEGSSLDLPLCMGILSATGQVYSEVVNESMFAGELSLSGMLRPVKGILPMAVCAAENNIKYFFVSYENAQEAAVIKNIKVIPLKSINQAVEFVNDISKAKRVEVDIDSLLEQRQDYSEDFYDVKGQYNARRAMEVAAAGGHNIIMIGSPGCGKTMIARRIPSILPSMSIDEALEVTKIYSITGTLPEKAPIITQRPFRNPHHTISDSGLAGGGAIPRPGEISLSNHGVLFLDEMPEFRQSSLEVLRQPLEDGKVTISRSKISITYPSRVMLVCAANPCRCGYYLDSSRPCTCTPMQVKRYLERLSGPLIDRLDIQIELNSLTHSELDSEYGESSYSIRSRVEEARKLQLKRYADIKGVFCNAQLSQRLCDIYCKLDLESKKLLSKAFDVIGLSARAYSKILKISRTIADLQKSEDIKSQYIAEALQYRGLDRLFGKNK